MLRIMISLPTKDQLVIEEQYQSTSLEQQGDSKDEWRYISDRLFESQETDSERENDVWLESRCAETRWKKVYHETNIESGQEDVMRKDGQLRSLVIRWRDQIPLDYQWSLNMYSNVNWKKLVYSSRYSERFTLSDFKEEEILYSRRLEIIFPFPRIWRK